MAADLAHQSYISSTLLDTFLKDTPKVTLKHASDLKEKDEWNNFIAKCTGGENSNLFTHTSSESNEKEFKALVQCIASLEGLRGYFEKPQDTQNEPEVNKRRGCIRISHQGNYPMTTWNTKAEWLKGDCGSTARQNELKPDLMTIVVEDVKQPWPRGAQPKRVQLTKPQTILPPPDDWEPELMDDKCFPTVECTKPVWECLDLFWECKRNSNALNDAEVYIDCALKATEALRYQWSRRYIYCFLHCGSMMRLLHFDRSGLMASEVLDIKKDTVKFIQCLLGAFYHQPSRLGYPAGKKAPFHMEDPEDKRLRQVVTVDDHQLYIKDQVAGSFRDHLVSRATVTFKAKLVNPEGEEKQGWDWCYKSSWPQKLRKHEGSYLKHLQGLPNVVDLLVYSVIEIEDNNDTTNDTTVFGRQCPSGEPMTLLETFYNKAKGQRLNFTQHTGTIGSGQEDSDDMLYDPRRPKGESQQKCDDREHRDIVIAWVRSSFQDGISSSLDSLPTISSIWQQAFSAIKAITEKGVVHRDISFQNIRIDDENRLKVCDFDMAMFLEDEGTGAAERTGTIAFMAVSILGPLKYLHRPIHDCESIFWLCTLDLLRRIGVGSIKTKLATIMHSGSDIDAVESAKVFVVSRFSNYKSKTQELKSNVSLDEPTYSSLFFCLTTLMREFVGNDYIVNYITAKPGIEDVCFDRCVEIIRGALGPAVQ